MAGARSRLSALDRAVVHRTRRLAGGRVDDVARAVSSKRARAGAYGLAVLATAVEQRSARPLIRGPQAFAAGQLVAAVASRVIGRRRPAQADPTIDPAHGTPRGSSFPSTHTSGAFALATALGVASPRLRRPFLLGAAAVGAARVVTGSHHPSDVVAGALLGSATGFLLGRRARRQSSRGG